jgi:exonuclease VII large subunit
MNAIIASVQQAFATIQESVHSLYESISLYHPNTILAQGYALVRKNDMLLR